MKNILITGASGYFGQKLVSFFVNGTKNVLNTSAIYGVKQICYCSSTTAYGFHPNNLPSLIEESPLRGNKDFTYAKNRRELETWAGEFKRSNPDISLIVTRPCCVVGPI
jgi:UDP-glucose 4-epimerase